MKILGNPDWTNPAVRAKNAVAAPARRALGLARAWSPKTAAQSATIQTDTLELVGDKPAQRRLVYVEPRPEKETASHMIYTPAGMAVLEGRIVERFSVRAPSLPEILKTPRRAVRTVSEGTIIEAETPYTYGDWVGDFLCSLTSATSIVAPIILPPFLAEKPYVSRDLGALGLAYVVADEPILIERAHILRKRIPSYYWGPEHVAAYQNAFGYRTARAREGSITYLGRYDTVSESVQRAYPTETVARIVRDLGGDVFDARKSSPQAFSDIAGETETIIADQGSAIFGVMQWRTKNLIELTRRDWWHSANLFIAKGANVENYAVIAIDDLSEDELRARIEGHLSDFGVRALSAQPLE